MRTDQPQVSIVRAAVAEVVGTFILVFAGTAVVTAAALNKPIAGATYNSLAVGLAFGLALAALVAAIGHVSGSHVNPAVTLGLASIRRFPWKYVPVYWIAQLIGAILASLAVWATFGDAARSVASLGATFPTMGTSMGQAFLMEVLITFILVFTVVAVATDTRAHASTAGLAIGFALAIAVLIGGPVSGGSANPARTLGPMIIAGDYTGVWIYIIAPLIGGVLAALIYHYFLSKGSTPEPEPEQVLRG